MYSYGNFDKLYWSMKVRIAQLIVSKDIDRNADNIIRVLNMSTEQEWIIFPEGMISGYFPEDENFLLKLDPHTINKYIDIISQIVKKKDLRCIVGTALKEHDCWYNCSVFISPEKFITYRKNNLNNLDRKQFTQGNELNVYEQDGVKFGIQICREVAFPEQWKSLKKKGAQIVFHINNAVKVSDKIREHVVITRAFENQIWVCSVNNASPPQEMSSMVVNPLGMTVWQSTPQKEEVVRLEIDLNLVSTDYLKDERNDLVDVIYKN